VSGAGIDEKALKNFDVLLHPGNENAQQLLGTKTLIV